MNRFRSHRVACAMLCVIVIVSAPLTAQAQTTAATPSQAEAQSAAAKASPELVNGLAKEIGSTPEQAAGLAGALLGVAKAFMKPEDFASASKGIPGIDALLAASPTSPAGTTPAAAFTPTPGFASSSSASGATMAAPDAMTAAMSAFPKISPEMLMKALPFLSGYLKKYGGAAVGGLLDSLFKKAPAK